MNKKIIAMAVTLLMLSGCTATNTDIVDETTLSETITETTSDTAADTVKEAVEEEFDKKADVHDWEVIDYTADTVPSESGRTIGEEMPFRDYALKAIGVDSVVQYFEENSERFAQCVQDGTSYSANVACIHGDFDKDGEMEYLVATNYGHSMRNDVAIVDNGKIVFWADDECADNFYKVRVGEYFKADPDKLTDGVLEDYIKYTYVDIKSNDDNMFIGVRDNQREAINYYYQIAYDKTEGYSIKLVKRVGWETVQYEGENGPVVERRFIEEVF